MAQDYYDILQPFDYVVNLLDTNRASLGLRYIAQNDEQLIPEYPAVLVQTDATSRRQHATRQFYVEWAMDLWVFHASLTDNAATRSRKDIELATAIRKLLHTKKDMDGHIVQSWIDGEFPGVTARIVGGSLSTIVTTRLTWHGENRVPFELS